MFYKERTNPVALTVMQSFDIRTKLAEKEKKYYLNQLKGYEGERMFDTYLEKAGLEGLILNDLCLKVDGSFFQIDSSIIIGDTIYMYEIKNYLGSYEYKNGSLQSGPDFEILDPLNRCSDRRILLQTLLRKLGYRFKIEIIVVFVHPEFYLYNAPRDKPFIFAGQLSQHLNRLARKQASIGTIHTNLAGDLCRRHIKHFRPRDLPSYAFEELDKGIYCPRCFSFEHTDTRQNRICQKCGYKETIAEAILRGAEEFHLLYPEDKIRTRIIHKWNGGEYTPQRTQDVLGKNYQMVGDFRWAYYEPRDL